MAVSIAAVMRRCRNYFETGYLDGAFRITGNALPEVEGARYVYISGSHAHDGVWEACGPYLTGRSAEIFPNDVDEFDGRIWFLDPPADFLELCAEIAAYEAKNPVGALMSESFGNYSYTRAALNGSVAWSDVFASQLAPYRHMYTEVK